MNEFLKTLTHGRKLQGAVKELSIQELEEIVVKLRNIIETRKQKESEKQAAEKEKLDKIAEIQKQLQDAGITFEDLASNNAIPSSKRVGQKRPIKYSYTDSDGEVHNWTGIGRMPLVFAEQLKKGKSLEDFSIN
ncbi:H-NS histone family protein [Planctobacterium marinum]|uniref:H-NS histone family protein n=1 Tax=Planctobacterium marinum TaxID=1631968 RepID=UPI001E43877C|nr:H-NS family nucleoid-associated regulatory protein [Planctobacterium marinum]MCC2603910.1 H-NS histone family protein [Planctobacterium marinum]